MAGSVAKTDRAVLDSLARAGLEYVRLPNEADLVARAIPPDEPPARRLAAMARRGSLFRISKGVYVVARSGAVTVRQAAEPHLLLAAMFEDRRLYYLGFLNALAEHGLTDEPVTGLRVAVDQRLQGTKELAGMPLVTTTVASDSGSDPRDEGDPVETHWLGVERVRVRGRMFYRRASPERALVDALDRPRLCGHPELWVRAWSRALREPGGLDLPLLLVIAQSRSQAVAARAAVLLRELGRGREAELLVSRPVTGSVFFDASNPMRPTETRWRRDHVTGLLMNVPIDVVRGWLEYGK